MGETIYEGDVCYRDGWHWSVAADGEPDQKLYLEEDGSYRAAVEGDESWHDRYHQQFVTAELT